MKKKYIQSIEEIEEKIGFNLLLDDIYENKLTCREIESKYNIDQRFMSKLNKEMDLGIKKSWSQQKAFYMEVGINKEDLYSLYIDQELSTRKIAEFYNTTHGTIKNALVFFDICDQDNIRPSNYDSYYESRRTSKIIDESRIYQTIMQEYIGRPLTEYEVVHHIDMDRSNNDIDNLFLFENERIHALYHGYISSNKHNYISPQEFIDNIYPSYETTFLDIEWLYEHYITNNESISFIAKLCGVSRISIKTSLSLFDLLDKKELRVNQYDK